MTRRTSKTKAQLIQELDELQKERSFAESVVKRAPVIVLVLDTKARIISFNPYMEELSGYRLEEVKGKDWLSVFLPEKTRPRIRKIFAKAIGNIQTRGNINPILTKDGRVRDIEWYDKTLKDSEGNPLGLVCIGLDITDRKNAEQELRAANQQLDASNQQLRATEQQLKAANHQLQASNRELQEQTYKLCQRVKELNCLYTVSKSVEKPGVSLEQIFRDTVDVIPASWQYPEITCARIVLDDREFKTENFRKTRWQQSGSITVHGKRSGAVEVCYLKKMPDEEEGPFLKEERSLLNALAQRLGKIIERIRSEKDLRRSELNLAITIDSIGDAVIATDGAGSVTRINPVAEALTGWSVNEARGRPLSEVFHIINEKTRQEAENPVQKVLRQGKVMGLANHTVLVSRDGTERPIGDSAAPIVDRHGGEVLGVVLVFRDLSRERQAQLVLRQREEIKISLKQKELLIKEVHHRIKNSLQVMSSLLDMKSMRTEDQTAQNLLADARSKIHTMALIHAQLHRGDHFDQIHLKLHIEELVDYLTQMHGSTIPIMLNLEDNIFVPLRKAIPLAFVLNELVSNALRHAFPGGKQGRVNLTLRKSGDDTLYISIADNGIGLPRDIDINTVESMGLKLVRQLVLHQIYGSIDVKRHKGTEFIIQCTIQQEENAK